MGIHEGGESRLGGGHDFKQGLGGRRGPSVLATRDNLHMVSGNSLIDVKILTSVKLEIPSLALVNLLINGD